MANTSNDPLIHRKGSRKLTITGKDGKPLKNQAVKVKMINHAFLFGCTEFSALPYANGELQGREKEITEERFRLFFDLFNYTTLPFYWGRFEPVKGKPDTKKMRVASEWLVSNGVKRMLWRCRLKMRRSIWFVASSARCSFPIAHLATAKQGEF